MKVHSTAIENLRNQQKLGKELRNSQESKVSEDTNSAFTTIVFIGIMIGLYLAASLIYTF